MCFVCAFVACAFVNDCACVVYTIFCEVHVPYFVMLCCLRVVRVCYTDVLWGVVCALYCNIGYYICLLCVLGVFVCVLHSNRVCVFKL